MIQVLKGITIKPQGNKNRFKEQEWPTAYAFGGWIYDISTEISYSDRPTEIKVHIALQTSSFAQNVAFFDINDDDLNCSAGIGGLAEETWFDIDLDGYTFTNFLLYSYDIGIQAGQKVLEVTFRDYSVILDKIYVGLFKKEGSLYTHYAPCAISMPIRCETCEYSGNTVTGTGITMRDIAYASYAGMNDKNYDGFKNTFYDNNKNVFDAWGDLIKSSSSKKSSTLGFAGVNGVNGGVNNVGPTAGTTSLPSDGDFGQFDLNGGYLILGTESATSERCNSSPDINYSFIELLSSLRVNGLSFTGNFPAGTGDSNFIYRNNYNGTLRTVLENWCADLGYTFYCSGRTFNGVSLKSPINISDITKIADPQSEIGKNFQINHDGTSGTVILSMNKKSSLDGTFKQAVILENSYPRQEKTVTKTVKKYVGIVPLHPISLNEVSNTIVKDVNLYGTKYNRRGFDTIFFDAGWNLFATKINFSRLDGRSYSDLDAAIALTNYNSTLRDLWVAQRALKNEPSNASESSLTNQYCLANFNALGFFPKTEITGNEYKTQILQEFISSLADKDGVSTFCIDQKYYRMFIGYYFPEHKDDIVKWEKTAAECMYRYGVVTKGMLTEEPFINPDILNDISPTAGFYGENGLVYTRVDNQFDPPTSRYQDIKSFPTPSIFINSGYVRTFNSPGAYYRNDSRSYNFIPPGYSNAPGRIPTGLWISTLENPWGTDPANFQRSLNLAFDECGNKYPLQEGLNQVLTTSDRVSQVWSLEQFLPKPISDLSKIWDIISSDTYLSSNTLQDQIMETYFDLSLTQQKHCLKLHLFIVPDTVNHPNIKLLFTPRTVNAVNPVALAAYKQEIYKADEKKRTTETRSICRVSILDEMCQNFLTGKKGGADSNLTFDPTTDQNKQLGGCVILEDKNFPFLKGFGREVLTSPNSRTLDIYIERNPHQSENQIFSTFDSEGYMYFEALKDDMLVATNAWINTQIIYPIQGGPQDFSETKQANYSGILTTNINSEYRIPQYSNIYGHPFSSTGNNTSVQRIIAKATDQDLNPILDPSTNKVISYVTVISGGAATKNNPNGNTNSIITTPSGYYNFISGLNNYSLDTPMKSIDISLAGSPSSFPTDFMKYLNPSSGLSSMRITIGENGVKTDLTFSDRPKVLPKQESILNKIGPRIQGRYK
jgi:hypothetical protein